MAIITFSPGWGHVHGHLSGFVYKHQQGKDILTDKPDPEPPRDSPAQLAQQDWFRQGTVYAKGTKHDAEAYAAYRAKVRERRSNPFAVVVRDWMNAPVVTAAREGAGNLCTRARFPSTATRQDCRGDSRYRTQDLRRNSGLHQPQTRG